MASNRDSLSSTTSSSYSSRSSQAGRGAPSLTIRVPNAAPFLPSTLPRPPSSLSQQTHWTDVSTDSAEELNRGRRAREESSGSSQARGDDWEEIDEDDEQQVAAEQRATEVHVPHSAISLDETIRLSTTPRRPSPAAPPPAQPSPPTTPLTLPPVSISHPSNSPTPSYAPILDDSPHHQEDFADQHRSSFPSSDEGNATGLGIGLGITARQRDDIRARAAAHAGRSLDLAGVEGQGVGEPWKDDALVEQRGLVGLGVGSSTEGEPLPFPSLASYDLPPPVDEEISAPRASRDLPPLPPHEDSARSPASPSSPRSFRPSTTSAHTSANSSNLSLPTAATVESVDLAHRPPGTFVSVASGPMGRLAADSTVSRNPPTRGPRAFLSNLLNRSPRATGTSPLMGSPTGSSAPSPLFGPPRSPSAPAGWQHPAIAAAQRSTSGSHHRSTSMPSPTASMQEAGESRSSLSVAAERSDVETSPRRTPRSIAAATFTGLARSASLRLSTSPSSAPTSPSQPSTSRLSTSPQQTSARPIPNSPAATIGFATPPQPAHDAPPPPPVQTLGSVGLAVVPLTTPMSLSRNAQPLCGALLDDKYLLIGTTAGLDFLPLPLPGSLPMRTHGKKRKETRKPISLIKRTRFKELAVLSERSNILLAIAGRNDHIRVYALDGIRAMIQKKMQELDARDGYPFIQDGALLKTTPASADPKGKARADPKGKARADPSPNPSVSSRSPPSATVSPANVGASASYQFPAASPPPDYSVSAPSPRRRPSSFHQSTSLIPPASPIRPHSTRVNSSTGSFVTAVPTNPRGSLSGQGSMGPPLGSPRSVRGQKSREFVASRRGSTTAVVARRKSRADISTPPTPGSRRSSVVSERVGTSTRPPLPTEASAGAARLEDHDLLGAEGASPGRLGPRRSSSASLGESGWATDPSASPLAPPRRMEPRSTPLSRSSTADLADFIRNSGPDVATVKEEEAEAEWRAKAQARRSASNPSVLQGVTRAGAPEVQRSRSNTGDGFSKESTLPQMAGLGLGGVQFAEPFRSPIAGLPRPIPREAASPRPRQGESLPLLELADLIRNSGPEPVVVADTTAANSSASFQKPEARAAASPRLQKNQSSPSMELAALLRETGPSSTSTSSSSSPMLLGGGFSSLPPSDPLPTAAPNGLLRRSPALNSVETLRDDVEPPLGTSRASNLFPMRPSSAASGSIRRERDSSIIPKSSSENSLSAPTVPGVQRRTSQRLVARKPTTAASPDAASTDDEEDDEDAPPRRRQHTMTLDEMIRDGPPPGLIGPSTSASQYAGLVPSGSSTSIHSAASGGGSPSNRSSKRWTMSGMSSKLLSRPSSAGDAGISSASVQQQQERRSMDPRPSSWDMVDRPPRRREESAPTESTAPAPQRPLPRSASTPLPPHDFKRSTSHLQSNAEQPQLAASSQLPPDAHPASSNSPLEYVKLARTKGARLLRAVETKKRTYLAVLCGDEGERIELFTGSRSISLSLNRTFVLPENPRTIEFQLQGDDLVDIYLVYPESIFALEPATVRVREVGVGRGERRARRERERRMRDIATSSTAPPADASPLPDTAANSALHPADPARNDPTTSRPATPNDDTVDVAAMALGMTGGSPSRSPSPGAGSRAQPDSEASDAGAQPPPVPPRTPTSHRPPPPTATPSSSSANPPSTENPPPVPPRSKHTLPYSTFQQLPFVPPVPSSVLSSAWIIPPLYTDVVGSGSPEHSPPSLSPELNAHTDAMHNPSITVTGEHGGAAGREDLSYNPLAGGSDLPLLSPISLLGGAAHRANGPPGLFFVSKGKNLSGIVTAEGKSIIKRPLVWSLDKALEGETSDVSQKIEMLVVGGTKTVVVGIGSSDVKAIAVGGEAGQPPFGAAIPVTAVPTKVNDILATREVQWLGTHAGSSQLFFAERVGQQVTVHCLFAKM